MKLITQIILLLFCITTFGQALKTTTIKLAIGDCRSTQSYFWNRVDTVTFYKLPEDTIALKVIPRRFTQPPVKLKNIPISEYKLTFKNNFNQLVIKQIKLIDKDTNSITLCSDSLLNYSQNTLAKLQDKDTISINFHSQGCFHATSLQMLIIREADNFVAKLCKVDSVLQTVTLTNKNIQDFIRFENELNYANNGGCTTTDSYEIKSRYLNITKLDGGCNWGGFRYLRESFFDD